jgi:4-deoxy-L-threo-5-hexosulose-uronate ketol-isomerase
MEKKYDLDKLDCLYLGKGTKKVSFASANKKESALYLFIICTGTS